MTLPATGAPWSQVLEPSLNPLAVRYWQVTDVLICDYNLANGVPRNWADPSVGLGTEGVFTPFSADNLNLRSDLLVTSPGSNQGLYHIGLMKEDNVASTPDQTVQETPSAQYVRTVRNVLTKLDDKVNFTPIEASPLVDYLNFELPLANGIPAVGTPGYQVKRGPTDVLVERTIILIGIDTDGNLLAKVYPRVLTDKKGKTELQRKNPESLELTYSVLPDPFSQQSMWICRAGSQWLSSGNFEFETFEPIVLPQTGGVTATVQFPTPIDVASPVYSVTAYDTAGEATSATLSGSPIVAGAFTTVTAGGLTAATDYQGLKVSATGVDVAATSLLSAPFTTLAAS